MPISAKPAVKMTADEFRRFAKSVYDDGYGDGYFEAGKGSGLAKAPEAGRDYDFEHSISKGYIDKALETFADKGQPTNCDCPLCEAGIPPDDRLSKIAAILETAVCTEGIDKGVILLSNDGPTHHESVDGRTIQVYDHEYFSPLGDALIAAWHLTQAQEHTP